MGILRGGWGGVVVVAFVVVSSGRGLSSFVSFDAETTFVPWLTRPAVPCSFLPPPPHEETKHLSQFPTPKQHPTDLLPPPRDPFPSATDKDRPRLPRETGVTTAASVPTPPHPLDASHHLNSERAPTSSFESHEAAKQKPQNASSDSSSEPIEINNNQNSPPATTDPFWDAPPSYESGPSSVHIGFEVNVRKCCRETDAFFESLNACAPFDTHFHVPGYSTVTNEYLNFTSEQMHIEEGLLTACAPSILSESEFVVLESGELFSSPLHEYFTREHYCVENIVADSRGGAASHARLTAAYCPNSDLPQTFDPHKVALRKCCPQYELVSSETEECILRSDVTSAEWTVPVQYLGLISSNSTNFTDIYEPVIGYPECVTKERGESLDSWWEFQVSEDRGGYLSIPSLGLFTPSYCIDDHHNSTANKSSSFAYVCLSDNDHDRFRDLAPPPPPLASCEGGRGAGGESGVCIQKCCPAGQLLDQTGRCVALPRRRHSDPDSHPPVYFDNGTLAQIRKIDFNYGSPACGSRGLFVTQERERGEIMANGSLRFVSYDPNECDPRVVEYIPQRDYCYDMVRFESGIGGAGATAEVPGALICYPKDHVMEARRAAQVNYIYSIFLVISDIFILISFVIYVTVPDQTKRGLNKNVKLGHSILGRILLSFLFSLFFAYLCLILTKMASDSINLASNGACIALGVTMYISFLATFFWLNVLCFELWWKCARQESTSGRRWLWYRVYAWGSPLACGAAVLGLEFSPSLGPCFIKPNFGLHSCFFSETRTFGPASKWVYLNGPVALLLATDLLFFLLTVHSLLQTVQQSHKGTAKRQARQRLKLCFKLFLVMGICWLTEIISVATSTSKWYITEVFNCLQGFVIFLIFILKPKIMHAVRERVCSVCCGQHRPREPTRGRLTFTASVLSDFLSSTKHQTKHQRGHPSLSSHNLSTSSFSTSGSSSALSWTTGPHLRFHHQSDSPSKFTPKLNTAPREKHNK